MGARPPSTTARRRRPPPTRHVPRFDRRAGAGPQPRRPAGLGRARDRWPVWRWRSSATDGLPLAERDGAGHRAGARRIRRQLGTGRLAQGRAEPAGEFSGLGPRLPACRRHDAGAWRSPGATRPGQHPRAHREPGTRRVLQGRDRGPDCGRDGTVRRPHHESRSVGLRAARASADRRDRIAVIASSRCRRPVRAASRWCSCSTSSRPSRWPTTATTRRARFTWWPRQHAACMRIDPSGWAIPDFFNVPVAGLLSRRYADALRSGISETRATPSREIKPGQPRSFEPSETTHYSVVDAEGNAVATTTTLNGSYGSGQMVTGAGFLLNNEMDDFSAKPGAPNMFGLHRRRGQRGRPRQADAELDDADDPREGRQDAAGRRQPWRQPHHHHGAAGRAQHRGLQDERAGSRGRAALPPPVAARTRFDSSGRAFRPTWSPPSRPWATPPRWATTWATSTPS